MIQHVVDRVARTGYPAVLAVPIAEQRAWTEAIQADRFALGPSGISLFAPGRHDHDVLGRYLDTALTWEFDPIVRVTGDCPFLDPA